jgi:hypothetical protein
MKKLVLSLLLAAGTLSVFGQGQVQFANNVVWKTSTDVSRLVYLGTVAAGNEIVGTQFRAQLYYGANASSLQPVATTGNAFRAPGTTSPGTWASPGLRTLAGFDTGSSVTLQVRAWDSTGGFTTFEQALAAGRQTGVSLPFTQVVAPPGQSPDAYYIEGLRAFAVGVPEPSTFALAGLGILGLVMARRRK